MKHFCFLLFFIGFFSLAEEDVLDVPVSSTDTAVDIQVAVPEEQKPSQIEALPPAEEQKPSQAEAIPLAEEQKPSQIEIAEDAPLPQEELKTVESLNLEETVPKESVLAEESEEVKSLRLKIKAYTPDYKYTGEGKKDPFSKPGALKDVTTIPEERLHPVEQDSIDNIQLRAIIWGRDGVIPRALFETRNKTYTLTKNDRIGQEGALIARIETNRVWTMKPVTDPATGQVRFEPYEKTLQTSGGSSAKGTELFYER